MGGAAERALNHKGVQYVGVGAEDFLELLEELAECFFLGRLQVFCCGIGFSLRGSEHALYRGWISNKL